MALPRIPSLAPLLAGAFLTLCAALAPPAHAADPVRIGAFLSVTGPAAFLGDPEQKTLELYVERINAEGGVLGGRKLELVSYDDAGDAEKARTFAKRLIEQDKVDVIVGGSATGTTMAAVPIAEQAGIPFISLAGAVTIIEPTKKWVFKTPHTDRMACEKIFVDAQSRKLTKLAMISGTGGFDKSMRAECLKTAAKYGVEFVADETYGASDTDMTAQLTKIKSSGAQAVLNAGFGQGPAIVTRNYRQVGLAMPLYQSHGVASREYIKLSGPAAEGVRLPAAALLVSDLLPAGDPQRPVVVNYRKTFEDKFKTDVSTFGGHAYDGLMLAVNAIKSAGSTDKAKVRDALEATRGYVGTAGVVNMSASDHMGLDLSAFRMLEVKDGNWVLIK